MMKFSNSNIIVLSLYLAFMFLTIGNSISFIQAQVENATIKNTTDTKIEDSIDSIFCTSYSMNAVAPLNPEDEC